MTELSDSYQDTSVDPVWRDPIAGTSFAAPVIAGAAGLFREWMSDFLPSSANSAGHVHAMLLAMGNGIGVRTLSGSMRSGVGEQWGVGKFLGHPPHVLPSWGMRQFALNVPEGWTLPVALGQLPTTTSVFKIGVHIDVSDLTQVPHILLLVKDACNGNQLIGHDLWFGFDKFIRIVAPATLSGICPVIEIIGWSVAANPPTVYAFAFWHSGNTIEH